jgi:hypothetical protein
MPAVAILAVLSVVERHTGGKIQTEEAPNITEPKRARKRKSI